jgi:hypothetical protein
MRCFWVALGLLGVLIGGEYAVAKSRNPAPNAPGFDFSQVDTICVMPVVDVRQDPNPALPDIQALGGLAMEALDRRGYQARSNCSPGTSGGAAGVPSSRWLLTIAIEKVPRVEVLVPSAIVPPYIRATNPPTGPVTTIEGYKIVVSGLLFDSSSKTEVWKGYATEHFGIVYGPYRRTGINHLLAPFGKRKNKAK